MDLIQDLGTLFNATTRNDWTDYRTTAASKDLPTLMRLESLRLTEFYKGMTKEQTDVEREVIRNEWRRRNEQSSSLIFDYLYNVVYPETHPYHSTSTHDTIDNIQLEDLTGYVDRYYTPANTTVMVVGDFDPGDASSLVFENFDLKLLDPRLEPKMLFKYPKPGIGKADPNNPAHWRTGAYDPEAFAKGQKVPYRFVPAETVRPRITAARDDVPPLGSKEVVTREAPIDNPTAVVGWSLPGGFRDDQILMNIMGNLAGNFVAQGLNQAYGRDAVTDVGCFVQAEVIHSTMMCFAEVKDKKLDPVKVTEKIVDQISGIWNPELKSELDISFSRVRMQTLASELYGADTVASIFGGRADNVGTFAHYTGKPSYYQDWFTQIFKTDVTLIAEMAYKYLQRDRAARLVVKPLPKEQIDVTSSASGYQGASRGDDVVLKTSDDLARVTPSDIEALYLAPNLSAVTESRLSNGLRVVVMKHGTLPIVQASLLFGGGPWTLPNAEWDFVSSFVQGAGNDPLQFAAVTNYPFVPGFAAASIPAASYPLSTFGGFNNAFRLDIKTPNGMLDGGLWTLRADLDGVKPLLDGAGEWKTDLDDDLKSAWKRKSWHLSDVVEQHLYPGAPWRQEWSWDDVQRAKGFSASTVQSFLDTHLRPENAVLMIVGAVEPEAALKLAEQYFGSWHGKAGVAGGWKGATKTPEMPKEATRVIILDDEKKTQTESTMTCRLNYQGEADRPAVNVLSNLAGARTFSTLRVAEGLAYSPFAFSTVSDDGSASLTFSSLATNRGVGRTVEFFLQTARDLAAGKITKEEVVANQIRLAREAGVASQSLDQMTARLTGPLRRQAPLTDLVKGGADVAGVTPEQLVRLVQGCAEHAIVTLEGPKSVIEPQLQEKGIASEVLDWKARRDALWSKHDPKGLEAFKKSEAKAEEKKKKEEEKKKGEEPTASGGSSGGSAG
jgi:predicted Zn-dependent peptidase